MSPRARRAAIVTATCLGLWLAAGAYAGYAFLAPARRVVRMPTTLGLTRREIPSGDSTRLGLWCNQVPDARGTVVLAHGFRSDPHHWELLIPRLTAAGLQTRALELRAHGQSAGDRISMGARERLDVAAAIDHASTEGLPVFFAGFSMGAASYLLSSREARAAVLDSPYDTLPNALRARWSTTHLPWLFALPAYLTVRARMPVAPDTLRPVDRVRTLRRPTLFVFAEHDHWVPGTSQSAYRRALSPSCRVHFVRGRGHGDHADEAWAQRITDFFVSALSRP